MTIGSSPPSRNEFISSRAFLWGLAHSTNAKLNTVDILLLEC